MDKGIKNVKFNNIIKNTYIQYTFLFFCFFICVFSPFIVYEKAYLWSSDGMSQHYPSLIYTKEWVYSIINALVTEHSLDIPFWDMNLGFGQDVFGNAINFRLFNFLYVLFPSESIELYLFFRSIASLYLCGIAYITFSISKAKEKSATLLGSMLYVFCGFSLYFAARHPFFLEMMFYFPLMLVGIEGIFLRKKSGLFIAMVFFSGISYFYFLYMITVPSVIYALFRYFEITKQAERNILDFLKTIGIFLWQYILGILLASFSLFPSIIRSLQSSRVKVEEGINYLHWESSFYSDLLKGIIDMQQIGIYGFIAVSGISLFSIIYIFCYKFKGKQIYIAQLFLYFFTFLVPFFALVFSGFAGRTQRWCFIFAFWIAAIVTEVLPLVLRKSRRIFIKSIIAIGLYLLVYFIICYQSNNKIESGCLWILAYMAILFLVNYTSVFENRRKILIALLMICLCAEITMKSYELFAPEKRNYISEYANAGNLIDAGNDNPSEALGFIEDDSIYRIDSVSSPLSLKYNQMNYGLRNYVNGISSYYSFSDGRICRQSLDLGNSQQNVSFLILDWDQRTALNTLSGVKYLATTDSSNHRVPYGYEYIGSDLKTFSDGHEEQIHLYENQFALPLMYVYDSYIPYTKYEQLKSNEKEQAMLQGIVLEEGSDYAVTNIQFDYQTLLNKDEILEQLKEISNAGGSLKVYEDHIEVYEDSVSVALAVEAGHTGEISWLMDGMRYHSKNISELDNWVPDSVSTISVNMDEKSDICTTLNNTYQYYMGKRDFLLNLGYGETSDSITVTFSKAGDYSFENLKLVCQPMEKYSEQIKCLKPEFKENVEIDTNEITATVNAEEKKLLCITVPYSQGWKAYVNGEETEVYPANGMYMAIELESGISSIQLKYRTPGIMIGCTISVVTLTAIIIMIVLQKRNSM